MAKTNLRATVLDRRLLVEKIRSGGRPLYEFLDEDVRINDGWVLALLHCQLLDFYFQESIRNRSISLHETLAAILSLPVTLPTPYQQERLNHLWWKSLECMDDPPRQLETESDLNDRAFSVYSCNSEDIDI